MSNGTPLRACLADSSFITIAIDPIWELACSAQPEGGTPTFMSPELLVPEAFSKTDATAMPQADIYAFGLVIYQVCKQDCRFLSFSRILSPGPYGRSSIPWYSAIGVGISRTPWGTPGQTKERLGHRVFRFAVEFHPTLLGSRDETATKGWGGCCATSGSSGQLGRAHAT